MNADMELEFGSVVTAMATPFDESGRLDAGGVRKLASHLASSGSHSIVVAGTTGEAPTLSDDEKLELVRVVKSEVGGSVKVLVGTSTYDTAHSVKLTEAACDNGADGILAVTPYYNRPTQGGLVKHFEAIAEASTVPVMLYNIPSRTGRRIEVDTLVELAEHPRIIGVKDAVGDLAFTAEALVRVPRDFVVYSGDDALTLPMMSLGAVGVVSVASHLAGTAISNMVKSCTVGALEEARRIHFGLLGLFKALFLEPNPIPLKAALAMCGLPAGDPRLPLTPAAETTRRNLESELQRAADLLDVASFGTG